MSLGSFFHKIFGGGDKTPREQVPGSKEWTALQLKPLTDIEKQTAQFNLDEAKKQTPKAEGAFDTSLDFYKKLLTGNYDDLTKLFDAAGLTKAQDQAEQVQGELGSRSGPRAATLGSATESRSADLNRFFETLRGAAPDKIANLGAMLANMGSGLSSSGQAGVQGAELLTTDLTQLRQNEITRHFGLINSAIGGGSTALGAYFGAKG